MTWFLYLACVITGVLCGGAFGYLIGFIFFSKMPPLPLVAGGLGAIIGTTLLLMLGRKLHTMMNER